MVRKFILSISILLLSAYGCIGQNINAIWLKESSSSPAKFIHHDSINYDSLGVISFDSAYSKVTNIANKRINHLSDVTLYFENSSSNPTWKFYGSRASNLFFSKLKIWEIEINAINGELIKFKKYTKPRANVNF